METVPILGSCLCIPNFHVRILKCVFRKCREVDGRSKHSESRKIQFKLSVEFIHSVGTDQILLLQSQIVSEIHCIVSAIKPLITWTCRDAIRECREACGGHGYHKGN